MPEPNVGSPSTSIFSKLAMPLLWGFVIALVASSVYLFLQVDRMRADLRVMREAVLAEVTKVQEASVSGHEAWIGCGGVPFSRPC